MNSAVIILGSYINGYSLIAEFFNSGVEVILGYEKKSQLGYFSRLTQKKFKIPSDDKELYLKLNEFARDFEKVCLFSTKDSYTSRLYDIRNHLNSNLQHPFRTNIDVLMDKSWQYDLMRELDIPFPHSVRLQTASDLELINEFSYPFIVRPIIASQKWTKKNVVVKNHEDLKRNFDFLRDCLNDGSILLISEFIQGASEGRIFAYTGYWSPSKNKSIGWTGRKLSQYPNDSGVFSSAESIDNETIRLYGEKIVERLSQNYNGILEPEFKWDSLGNRYSINK